jgi:predicted DCC family thiol-disulfide oxidoreductase YuxK
LAYETITSADTLASLDDLRRHSPVIIYDGDCIFCENYVRLYRARQSLGRIMLLNARELPEALKLDLKRSYDLNEGMLFIEGERVYFGADAVHALALVTSSSTIFNRLNGMVFRSKRLSRLLYPLLKFGRQMTLLVRGKSQIR